MKSKFLTAFCIMAILASCTVSNQVQIQKNWTVKEVQQWYNKDSSNTHCVLYRGTDDQTHHFLSQCIDKWVFLTVKKADLLVPEERPYKVDSAVKLGYYYVDPNNNFVKIREFN